MRRLAAALVAVLAAAGAGSAATPKTETPAAPAVDPAFWPALRLDRPARQIAAPPIEAVDVGGVPVSLASFRGRVVMLYFWATW